MATTLLTTAALHATPRLFVPSRQRPKPSFLRLSSRLSPSPLRLPFRPNPSPLRPICSHRLQHHRLSLLTPHCSYAPCLNTSDASNNSSIFGPPKQLSAPQSLVEAAFTKPVYSVVCAAFLAYGWALWLQIGLSNVVTALGATLLGVGALTSGVLSFILPDVAAVSLHNLVVDCDDPVRLKREEVDAIANRYGVSKQHKRFKAELCALYSQFVSSVLPPGNEDLKGNEVKLITKFKEALGIEDPDAASVHFEIGRRIYEQRFKIAVSEIDAEQETKEFQKFIYISALVFGEASKFLLPWKRSFRVTDFEVEVAIQVNARRLYSLKLNSISRDIQVQQLKDLREAQLRYKLSDEIAAEMFREHTRKLVEEIISRALSILKRTKTMGAAQVVEELESILKFNSNLSLGKESEVDLPPGVGPISLIGGEYNGDQKIADLKLLYRTYAEESFQNGCFQAEKLMSLSNLRNIFGLEKHEAESIMSDVTSRLYHKRLSQAFFNGDLDAAPNKAQYLQILCEELHFDPNNASKIHEKIYRQKVQQFMEDRELSEAEVSYLQRLRVNLSIDQETVDAVHVDICGCLFEEAVKDAIALSFEGYDAVAVRASVRKAAQRLGLTKKAAMAIASKGVRKMFLTYVQRASGAGSYTEAARELKKMIVCNSLVVTELIADIKGESTSAEPAAATESRQTDDENEWQSMQAIRRTRPSKELEAKMGKQGQTEINLKEDLSEREKADLYRTYLIYCVSGEVIEIPFGAQICIEKDNSEFMLVSQLGGILGLTTEKMAEVHRSLAVQALTKQAKVILADGQLTAAKVEQLNEMQKQVGLPTEYAQKIIKNIITTKLATSLETAVIPGLHGIQEVQELKNASVDIASMVSEKVREDIFRKKVAEIFSSGTGEFDEAEIYEKYPADLSIDADKAKDYVKELAQARLVDSLFQAITLFRHGNKSGVVASLSDMLACDTIVSSEPLPWSSPEERADLYRVYLKNSKPEKLSPEKLSRLQYLLDISKEAATSTTEEFDILDPPW